MSNADQERERIKRIREQQLRARDPRKAERRAVRTVTRRRRQRYQRVTFSEMIRDIPHKWRGFIFGAVLGAVLAIVLPILFEGTLVELIGFLSIVVLALVGFAIGQAFDLRDELRDFSRRK